MDTIKNKKLVIFGTGEIGQLAKFYFDHDSPYDVVGFTADDEFVDSDQCQGLPVVPVSQVLEKFSPAEHEMHVALSYNKLNEVRAQKYQEAKALGYSLASYVCSKSAYWNDLSIGDNCLILENQTIQPTVKIGTNVMIWSGNHLGHGCEIQDHTYISSHVCIAGHAKIGQYCFLGINSTVKDFVTIGNNVFVAMGAHVTQDVNDNAVVVAGKSVVYPKDSKVAQHLKKRYFNL